MEMKKIELNGFTWIDVTAPTKAKLAELSDVIGLPEKMVTKCLHPDYLPHMDSYGSIHFVVLRIADHNSKDDDDTVQELTTKIALFIKEGEIYTVHRQQLGEITLIHDRIEEKRADQTLLSFTAHDFLQGLFDQAALSFDKPLLMLEDRTDHFEERIVNSTQVKDLLKDGFYIKRKASSYKKLIKFTSDVMAKVIAVLKFDPNQFGYIKEKLDRYQFYADDVFENIQSLLNLHLAIQSQKTNEASYRTNEIVRVLTVLTIFFLPLNFLAGLFGMNFEYMPLLNHPAGFWISLVTMFIICLGLLIYVVKKGWMSPPKKDE